MLTIEVFKKYGKRVDLTDKEIEDAFNRYCRARDVDHTAFKLAAALVDKQAEDTPRAVYRDRRRKKLEEAHDAEADAMCLLYNVKPEDMKKALRALLGLRTMTDRQKKLFALIESEAVCVSDNEYILVGEIDDVS